FLGLFGCLGGLGLLRGRLGWVGFFGGVNCEGACVFLLGLGVVGLDLLRGLAGLGCGEMRRFNFVAVLG
ncbi:hypothetical protein ABFV43_22290, partial [Pseudomonas fulva]|uniref:hypothetical protein n=1 Tax=Pseudomonas fulva TaxID=47880 RepID=UPI0034D39344